MMSRTYKHILFIFFLSGVIYLAAVASAQENTATDTITRPAVEYKSDQLRDPFKSYLAVEGRTTSAPGGPAQGELDLSKFTVQGIIWGGKMPQAIINNKVYNVGDSIDGAVIVSIDKSGITLSFGEKIYDLTAPGKKSFSGQANQGG